MDDKRDYDSADTAFDDAVEEAQPTKMNEATSQYFGTARQVVERYCHCQICGANLSFSHLTDFVRNTTQENARCPECGVQSHRVLHRLH